ncbi:hypothetical protein A2480_01365 [Candidatus Uhrbacteria bacterium RIFOXYC2_FULL_47_19]|uniref:Uncharacterized protein n=1 Tax=Candidatus Uhrbacteria bacterium RIFOXYC2_FULL_47_19 TaxID=1802424 RepID=A0A1F7WDI8_9BACT|nr:MAG: hypothetical protein A2480_01365 [Candidatus Uhrbacteria bacterium RIFOXYC2_FULL_47_19]HCC22185.1 hypothetical protein [Candidatus Uhrbacteria bacterium]
MGERPSPIPEDVETMSEATARQIEKTTQRKGGKIVDLPPLTSDEEVIELSEDDLFFVPPPLPQDEADLDLAELKKEGDNLATKENQRLEAEKIRQEKITEEQRKATEMSNKMQREAREQARDQRWAERSQEIKDENHIQVEAWKKTQTAKEAALEKILRADDVKKEQEKAKEQSQKDRLSMKKMAEEAQNRKVSGSTVEKARQQRAEIQRQQTKAFEAGRAAAAQKLAEQTLAEADQLAAIAAERKRIELLEALDKDEREALAEEQERQRLAREKREGIIAGKEAFDAEQAQIKGTEQWKLRRNESFTDSQLIRESALQHAVQGTSEKMGMEINFLTDSRDAATAQLFTFGIKDADTYLENLATSRWAQAKHALKMLSPGFRQTWKAFEDVDRQLQAAIKDQNFPDAKSIKTPRRDNSRGSDGGTFIGNLHV